MIVELKMWLVRCSKCPTTVTVVGHSCPILGPHCMYEELDGWQPEQIQGSHWSDPGRILDLCPKCAKATEEGNADGA